MIVGIGTDIVSIARIQAVLNRRGALFAKRVLTASEFAVFAHTKQPASWLAKRWAAKEAFGKAAGLGNRAPLTMNAVGVTNDALGKPCFELALSVQKWLAKHAIQHVHLSVSDELTHAIAFVIFER